MKRPNPSNFLHHLEVITVVALTRSWRKERKKVEGKGRKLHATTTKIDNNYKRKKLFGSLHFGTLMKIPRTMKYNGKSPMNEKILKRIIIAFSPALVSSPRWVRKLRALDETKEVIRRNFNWTFISVLENDFRFLPSHRKKNLKGKR